MSVSMQYWLPSCMALEGQNKFKSISPSPLLFALKHLSSASLAPLAQLDSCPDPLFYFFESNINAGSVPLIFRICSWPFRVFV